MLQCIFIASVYNDLVLYKQAFLLQKDNKQDGKGSELGDAFRRDSVQLMGEMAPFKIGIIGCGHLGTMILTKLLEISGSFNNLQLHVSTRQPHLLRPF